MTRTIIVALLLTAACFAQDKRPPEQSNSYKLNFIVKEVSAGKVNNTREYETLLRTGTLSEAAQIRAGDRVPIVGKDGNINYLDVGVNIDIRNVSDTANGLRLQVYVTLGKAEHDPAYPNPIIRQTQWSGNVTVPLRKPTTLFSSDSVDSKTQTQLELTATPLP